MITSLAVSIPQDVAAYEMLQRDYVDNFNSYYENRVLEDAKNGKGIPICLDELIVYTMSELPQSVPDCDSLSFLENITVKTEIKRRFLTANMAKLLTDLAKRETIKSTIRKILHMSDKQNNYAAIESSKFDRIFVNFMKMFETSCAGNYKFEGQFIAFVSHCFNSYYYVANKKDIWDLIRGVDYSRKETEMTISSKTVKPSVRKDNLQIHELITNIVAANDLIFSHSGQCDDAYGVCYDIYYMVLLHLCNKKIKDINSNLTAFQIELIDEYDRIGSKANLTVNKSIASKIINARDLIPFLFDTVLNGNWNLDNLVELRDQCFNRGKKYRDGKNCVWIDVEEKAETCRYFDRFDSSHNFSAFEILFKGVLSVYSLMMALRDRDIDLIESYPALERIFKDKYLARYVSSIDDIKYIDLIKQLQAEPIDKSKNVGELLTFDKMVNVYAGSVYNNKKNIRNNRYEAELYGLLDNPSLKQKGLMQRPFDQLASVAFHLVAIPRSYIEYYEVTAEMQDTPTYYGTPAMLTYQYIVRNRYNNFTHNKFFTENQDLASYYLYDIALNTKELDDLSWHLCTAEFPFVGLSIAVKKKSQVANNEFNCLYIPLTDSFMVLDLSSEISNSELELIDIVSLQTLIRNFSKNPNNTVRYGVYYDRITDRLLTDVIKEDLSSNFAGKSLGFDSIIGMSNLLEPNIKNIFENFKVYPKYHASVCKYFDWMGELAIVQNSLVDLMYLMYSYALVLVKAKFNASSGDMKQGKTLIESFLNYEFNADNLDWFFNVIGDNTDVQFKKLNFEWGNDQREAISFTRMDMRCLKLIYNKDTSYWNEYKYPLVNQMLSMIENLKKPSERFVYIYNFVNICLTFIRLLRDGYSLTFNAVFAPLNTFGCELNSRFKIMESINNAKASVGEAGLQNIKYALIDSVPVEESIRFLEDTRIFAWEHFQVLCEDLETYFNKCSNHISSLVDYEIVTSVETHSKFESFGELFTTLGSYTSTFVVDLLRNIRSKAKVDSAGFIILKNAYLKARLGESEYYIHRTGRVVEVSRGEPKVRNFDFNHVNDRNIYRDMINNALNNNVW